MKKIKFLLGFLLAFSFVFSCAKKPPPGELIDEEPIIIEEAEEGEIFEEFEEIVEEVAEETTVVVTPPPPPPEPTTVYRIQIGAFYSSASADKRKARAVSLFAKPVYVKYIAPYYKVRVGDFSTKNEADSYKTTILRFYSDAFVTEVAKTP